MLNHTARSTTPAAPGAMRPLALGLQRLADCLEHTQASGRTRVVHVAWLVALVAAGAFVRFAGLGAVGLHGDEETMALAVRHILIDGRPILPSGMFYPRGMTQLYMMAASVSVFGETEWALRLPSVLCGLALIVVAYDAGRRFLRPEWSLALAAVAAFLPQLIVDSQTARMYIFLVMYITCSMACLWRWERTNRDLWLAAAAGFLILGLDMHALAVGAVLMFLIPGVVRGHARQILLGSIAAGAVVLVYVLLHSWVQAQYPSAPPPEFVKEFGAPPPSGSLVPLDFNLAFDVALWSTGVAMSFLAVHAARSISNRSLSIGVAMILLAGIMLQLAVYYHLAALAYLLGFILLLREGSGDARQRTFLLLTAAALLLLVHSALLMSAAGAFIKLVGALVGKPSVWPYARIAQVSWVGGALTAALLVWGLYLLVNRRRAPDYWLLAVFGVWAPVFALGIFAWNVPPRYTAMSFAPMLVCALAFAQRLTDEALRHCRESGIKNRVSAAAAALIAIFMLNPLAVASTVNAGYDVHPDHKGAAEFVRAQDIIEEDVLVAEDVLQQTYYLGKVDYWLIGPKVARRFVERTEQGIVDIYTGTPVIASAAQLEQLVRDNESRRIFIIGTGEGWRGGRRPVRENMHPLLESARFTTAYTGRDQRTRVLQPTSREVDRGASNSGPSHAGGAVAPSSILTE